MAQLSLPVLHAVAGAILIAGTPMKAAIGVLMEILQVIDVRAYLIARTSLDFDGQRRDVLRIRRTNYLERTIPPIVHPYVQRADCTGSSRTTPEKLDQVCALLMRA